MPGLAAPFDSEPLVPAARSRRKRVPGCTLPRDIKERPLPEEAPTRRGLFGGWSRNTEKSRVKREARNTYLTSVSSLNIGRYMLMMMTPTMIPTPTIISGSMIEVRAAIDASTSSS